MSWTPEQISILFVSISTLISPLILSISSCIKRIQSSTCFGNEIIIAKDKSQAKIIV